MPPCLDGAPLFSRGWRKLQARWKESRLYRHACHSMPFAIPQPAWAEAGSSKEIILAVTYTRMTSRWNECQAGRRTSLLLAQCRSAERKNVMHRCIEGPTVIKHPGNSRCIRWLDPLGLPVCNGALHHRKYFSSTIAFTILECSAHTGAFLPVLARIVQASVDHSAAGFYLRFRSPLHLRRPLAGACLL